MVFGPLTRGRCISKIRSIQNFAQHPLQDLMSCIHLRLLCLAPALSGRSLNGICFRWKGKNGPEQTDWVATSTLIRNTPKSVKRFGLISSLGVERYGSLPFNILNLGGESDKSCQGCWLYPRTHTLSLTDLKGPNRAQVHSIPNQHHGRQGCHEPSRMSWLWCASLTLAHTLKAHAPEMHASTSTLSI